MCISDKFLMEFLLFRALLVLNMAQTFMHFKKWFCKYPAHLVSYSVWQNDTK